MRDCGGIRAENAAAARKALTCEWLTYANKPCRMWAAGRFKITRASAVGETTTALLCNNHRRWHLRHGRLVEQVDW